MKKYKTLSVITASMIFASSFAVSALTTDNSTINTPVSNLDCSIPTDSSLFEYSVNNNQVTITKYKGTDAKVVIPAFINKMPVTAIGSAAFQGNSTLESITSLSVTTINNQAFMFCTNLSNVNIPLVKTIGDNSFNYCSSLESINFYNVRTIGSGSFAHCTKLTNINMPLLQIIDIRAFDYCTSLQSLYFQSVKIIYNDAFNNSSIQSINLPSVTELDNSAFIGASKLTNITLSSNLTKIGFNAFYQIPINSITIDYGKADISGITMNDWNQFTSTLNGLDNIGSITGRYVKNYLGYKDLNNPDTQGPTINLIGPSTVTLKKGSKYIELGATATDNCAYKYLPVSISGTVDTLKVGTYIITYSSTDVSGNVTQITRTVNVI